MHLQQIVETSRTFKEALERQGLTPSFYQRERLKQTMKEHGWVLNSHPREDSPIGTTGVWATLTPREFAKIISICESWTQVMRHLALGQRGSSTTTAHKYAKLLNLDTTHFKGKSIQGRVTFRRTNEEIFVENSPVKTRIVRERVLKENLIPYTCSSCGQLPEHNGKPLTLQLEHRNGNSSDHRLNNLTFLCPNCHTQTPTWGRKCR